MSRRRLIVRDEAEEDITKAALWYDERESGLGLELTLEVRAAIRRVIENPLHHPLLRHRPEGHRVLARRFPYRVFFIASSSSRETTPSLCLHRCVCRPPCRPA